MYFHILSSGLCFWKVTSRKVFAVKEEALVRSLPRPRSSGNSAIFLFFFYSLFKVDIANIIVILLIYNILIQID